MILTAGGRRRMSLRVRVTWLAASCVAGAVALVSLGAYLTVRQNLYDQIDASLRAEGRQHRPLDRTSPTPRRAVPGRVPVADRRAVRADRRPRRPRLRRRHEHPPPIGAGETRGRRRATKPTTCAPTAAPTAGCTPCPTAAARSCSRSRCSPTKEQLTDLSLVLFLIGGAGVVVAAAAGTAVARTGLRPVQRLTRATERVAQIGDLRPIQRRRRRRAGPAVAQLQPDARRGRRSRRTGSASSSPTPGTSCARR